jgi:hypothetical protein
VLSDFLTKHGKKKWREGGGARGGHAARRKEGGLTGDLVGRDAGVAGTAMACDRWCRGGRSGQGACSWAGPMGEGNGPGSTK